MLFKIKTAWRATMTSSKEGNLWDDRDSHRTADFINNAILNFLCVFLGARVQGTPIASKASLKLHQDDWILLADTFFFSFWNIFHVSSDIYFNGRKKLMQQHHYKWVVTFYLNGIQDLKNFKCPHHYLEILSTCLTFFHFKWPKKK